MTLEKSESSLSIEVCRKVVWKGRIVMQTSTQSVDSRKGKPPAIAFLIAGYLIFFSALARTAIRFDDWASASVLVFLQTAAQVGFAFAKVCANLAVDTQPMLFPACRIFMINGLAIILTGPMLLTFG
jgi:hypothetical protein